jgi:hypothetical protein
MKPVSIFLLSFDIIETDEVERDLRHTACFIEEKLLGVSRLIEKTEYYYQGVEPLDYKWVGGSGLGCEFPLTFMYRLFILYMDIFFFRLQQIWPNRDSQHSKVACVM